MHSTTPSWNSKSSLPRHPFTGQPANNHRARLPIALVSSSQHSLFILLLVPSLPLILWAICLIIFTSRSLLGQFYCLSFSVLSTFPLLCCHEPSHPYSISCSPCLPPHPLLYFPVLHPSPIVSVNNHIATQSCHFRVRPPLRSLAPSLSLAFLLSLRV